MYSLSSLLKVFADQVDKAELRKITKPYLKMGLTLQKLVKPSNFFKGEVFYRQFERCVLDGLHWERALMVKLSPYPLVPKPDRVARLMSDLARAAAGLGESPSFELWCRTLSEIGRENGWKPDGYITYALIMTLETHRIFMDSSAPLSDRAAFFEHLVLGFLRFAKNDPYTKEVAEKLLERLGETDDARLETAYRAVCDCQSPASSEPDERPETSEASEQSDAEESAESPESSEATEIPETVEAADTSRMSDTSGPVTPAAIGRRLDPRKIRTKRKARENLIAAVREAAKKKLDQNPAEKAVKTADSRASDAVNANAAAPAAEPPVTLREGTIERPDTAYAPESLEASESVVSSEVSEASDVHQELESLPKEATSFSSADRFAELFALDPSAATRTVFDLPCAPESGHGASSATDGAGSTAEPALYERLPKPAYGRARVLAYMRRAGTFMNLFFTHRLDALGNYVKHDFTSEFPRLGAANLRTHRKARLQEGAFYVCDLESDDSFVNRDAGSITIGLPPKGASTRSRTTRAFSSCARALRTSTSKKTFSYGSDPKVRRCPIRMRTTRRTRGSRICTSEAFRFFWPSGTVTTVP